MCWGPPGENYAYFWGCEPLSGGDTSLDLSDFSQLLWRNRGSCSAQESSLSRYHPPPFALRPLTLRLGCACPNPRGVGRRVDKPLWIMEQGLFAPAKAVLPCLTSISLPRSCQDPRGDHSWAHLPPQLPTRSSRRPAPPVMWSLLRHGLAVLHQALLLRSGGQREPRSTVSRHQRLTESCLHGYPQFLQAGVERAGSIGVCSLCRVGGGQQPPCICVSLIQYISRTMLPYPTYHLGWVSVPGLDLRVPAAP